MKLRTIIASAVGLVALAGSLGLASPAFANTNTATVHNIPLLTERYEASYEGSGNYLASCDAGGDTVYFISEFQTGCYDSNWTYQAYDDGSYWIHPGAPGAHTNLCLTDSTTQKGVEKIEGCVQAGNQLYFNPNNGTYYKIESLYYSEYINDPGAIGTTHPANLSTAGYGDNGDTLYQSAP